MEITTLHSSPARTELALTGRLDGYWADHLSKSLEEVVRGGARTIVLDLAGLTYVSSLGLRVFVQGYKTLAAIQGTLAVTNPSPGVRKVLSLTGLLDQLMNSGALTAPADKQAPAAVAEHIERESASYDRTTTALPAAFRLRAVGAPDRLAAGAFDEASCRTMSFPESTVGLGLGAFGNNFEDSRPRFGEFLAAGAAAAYQPADGSNVADYVLAGQALVPEVQVLYGLTADGRFGAPLRFNAKDAGIGLSALLADVLEIAQLNRAVVAIAAESGGLLGAALRKSPVGGGASLFAHPEIRTWISFTPDKVYARSMTLALGFVSKSVEGSLAPFLRPIGNLHGHFHAAAFSYRPLRQGTLDFSETARLLFSSENLQGVLHLVSDDRGGSGGGESEFVRGAVWIAPFEEVTSPEVTA